MRSWIFGLFATSFIAVAPVSALASSLQVMPVNIEVPAPGAASTVSITNSGAESVNAQIRIFKWVQVNGQDELVPTKDVVASPPALKMQPGKKNVIRIVRLSKTPAAVEETYRLVVDEVPKPPKPGQAGVAFAVRYSIPVFFSKPGADIEVSWKVVSSGGKYFLTADNKGGRRIRVASLRVLNGAGKSFTIAEGLAGYVLGQSSKKWLIKGGGKSIVKGGPVRIVAMSDNGPIEATANVVTSK